MSRLARALAPAAALSLLISTPAFAGPPLLSLEIPANPYNETTRGAFALVRVYHHGDVAYYPVNGTAEGLIDGTRRSIKIELTATSVPGVYAIKYAPAKEGAWILVVSIGQKSGDHGQATMLVTLRNGEVASVKVPTRQEGQWLMPDGVSSDQIDQMLRQQLASSEGSHNQRSPLALAGLVLLPLGMLVGFRRR
jgi:hypothetical protein